MSGLLTHQPVVSERNVGRCALGCGATASYSVSASDGGTTCTTWTCGKHLRRGEARALRMLATALEEVVA